MRRASPRPAAWPLLTVFWSSGFVMTSWVARVPGVRDSLEATSGMMGVLALAITVGSVLGFAVAQRLLLRVTPRQGIAASIPVAAAGLVIAGVSSAWPAGFPAVLAGLGLLGLGNGVCNVAMNVQGAALERMRGRPLMPWLHALFSVGAASGAAAGALAATLGVAPWLQFAATAVIAVVVLQLALRGLAPRTTADEGTAPDSGRAAKPGRATGPSPWREPRTVMIGLAVAGLSFANGAGNDWIALGLVDGHGVGEGTAALAIDVFAVSIVLTRLAGVALLSWLGRVRVIRCSAVVTAAGLLLFILVPGPVAAFAGVVLWGVGVALSFPTGMSAAGDDPERAAGRITVVVMIGYTGSFIGPPLIGFLAEGVGVLNALAVVLVVLMLSLVTAAALRSGERVSAGRSS
ncbi:MFS transporter [Microbacterium tumbae]